jgi:hypothetical protein
MLISCRRNVGLSESENAPRLCAVTVKDDSRPVLTGWLLAFDGLRLHEAAHSRLLFTKKWIVWEFGYKLV